MNEQIVSMFQTPNACIITLGDGTEIIAESGVLTVNLPVGAPEPSVTIGNGRANRPRVTID